MGVLKSDILALVLAGGKGERLHPLTLERTKPSVSFGGKYRIIDFALSNLVNSGIYSIYVMVQYKSQSLIEHIRTTWRKSGVLPQHFITVVPPQMRREQVKEWYRGTADSVYQNINLIYDFKPKMVAIFSGDHVYRMDIKSMINFHYRNKSQATISVFPVNTKEAHHFGVVDIDKEGRIKNFREKPNIEEEGTIFASMGNYIFDADVLVDALSCMADKSAHDFGKDLIPYLVEQNARVYGYDFSTNTIPGVKRYESYPYWKDVGTIDSFWQANMDLLGKTPKLDLDNRSWPIYASDLELQPTYVDNSVVENVRLCEGVKIYGAKVKNSILGRGVTISEGCVIENSIIMDFSNIEKNCKIKNAIIDRFNIVNKSTKIGYDINSDKENYFVDSSGIVVLKRGSRKI